MIVRPVFKLYLLLVLTIPLATAGVPEREKPASTASSVHLDSTDPGEWLTGETVPGLDAVVHAVAEGPDGSVYLAGEFAEAGALPANRIVRWTPDDSGGMWTTLGEGLNNRVNALSVAPDGTLYAGGTFTSAGGVSAANVARFVPDGTGSGTWSALNNGVNTTVRALAFAPDGTLYAGGSFTFAGGTAVNHIARWTPDGSGGGTWSPLGLGVNSWVEAIAIAPDGTVFAGGVFTQAGGEPASHVARWTPGVDGNGIWNTLGEGVSGTVYALASAPGAGVIVGGTFNSAGSHSTNGVARWSETGGWSALGNEFDEGGAIYSLEVTHSGIVYVGGSFTTRDQDVLQNVAAWLPSGAKSGVWKGLGDGFEGTVRDLTLVQGVLYAGGNFTLSGARLVNHVARFDEDGTGIDGEWQPLGRGINEAVHAMVAGPDGSIYLGGYFTHAASEPASRVVQWVPDDTGGGSWIPLGEGVNDHVYTLAVAPDGRVYAGGAFTQAGSAAASRVATWIPNGTGGGEWKPLAGGVNGIVRALAVDSEGVLYAGGEFTSADGIAANRIARWVPDATAGGSWSAVDNGATDNVYALAFAPDGTLYVAGRLPHVIRISSSGSWSTISSPGERIYTMVVDPDGVLFVGGWMTGQPKFAARWISDGAGGGTWRRLGNNLSSRVYALAIAPDGSLYAGGAFTSICDNIDCSFDWGQPPGPPAPRIARWEPGGTFGSWHALGSGMGSGVDTRVRALVYGDDDILYAGGFFQTAGGKPSTNFARWNPLGPVTSEPHGATKPAPTVVAYPNPFASQTTIAFVLEREQPVQVVVFDIIGREIAVLAEERAAAGLHRVVWDASTVAAGLYVVRVEIDGSSHTVRVVRTR